MIKLVSVGACTVVVVLVVAGPSVTVAAVWGALEAGAAIVIPFLVLILTAYGRALWSLHNRLGDVEDGQSRHDKTLYGDPQDPMHSGIATDLRDVRDRVERVDERLADIHEYVTEEENDSDRNSDK